MKKIILSSILFFFLSITNVLLAQDFSFQKYNWDEKNTKIEIPDQYKNEKEVILNRIQKVEIVVEKNTVKQYYLLHEKVLVNSNDAIQKNNKIYLPFNQNENILINKVRVILQNGKVINLNDKDIKEENDEEKGVKYNYFAVNGLETGAVIEKVFLFEEYPEIDGKTIKMQDDVPIANLDFELISPKHLIFKTKSYNGLSEGVFSDTKLTDKNVVSISEKNIPALENEDKYANWNVNLKLFRFKLDENLASGAKNLYNFKTFASNTYDRLNGELEKKDSKAIEELAKSISKSNDIQEQVWNIENKIKKTINYSKYFEGKEFLADVIKTKQANIRDIARLYIAVLKHFNIENNLVFTSNRYKIPFDKDFESYENLNEVLFYLPTISKFFSPTEMEYRIPLIPNVLANNNGVFVKPKEFAGTKMGIGEVKFITIPGVEITHDKMDIVADFTEDIENPIITCHVEFGGYSALNFQPIKDVVPAEQYKTILKSIAENYTVETEYKTLTTKNDGTEFIGKKPFILDVTFDGKGLIQKAGENYLFSVGQTIGKQMELYQENKRTLPIEIDYPHSYTRTIKLILPKNMTAKNLDKLTMNYQTEVDSKVEAGFKSNYAKKENEIIIENTEFYNIVNYPIEKFDSYKSVINAAADFNKIVLILSK